MNIKSTLALTVIWFLSFALTHSARAGQTTQPKAGATGGGTMVFVHVKNTAGRPLPDVRLQMDGATPGQFKTDIEGTIRLTAMRDGSYHLHFERPGYSVMERSLTLHGGQPDVVDVVLTTELEKAQEPPASSASTLAARASALSATSATSAKPSAAPPMAAASTAARSAAPAEEQTVSITAFLDKNYISAREPLKESLLGCTASTRTRLLQLRDGLSEHTHDNVDETLYVVAGEGAIVVANRPPVQVGPASLVVIPGGLPHSVQRRGKNPLIVLSTLSGLPCNDKVAATDQKQ
ncbi:MAG TPA: carboxypeptidase regulatory-like domain-containing protein [Vicinamibacterales bacterium]|nr:carboxypeptidase regulatory-like domain-containing protein [Vicinamibacterales bacterium]